MTWGRYEQEGPRELATKKAASARPVDAYHAFLLA